MHKETSPPPSVNIPLLPPDTLAIILNFLSTSKSTLHSCALVNRMWCRLSIPLLWSNPLSLLLQSSSPSDWCAVERNSVSIIETYVACFSDEEKQHLVDAGVIDGDDEAKRRGKPLFDYTIYLKSIDCEKFHCAVDRWVSLMREIRNERGDRISVTPLRFPALLTTSTFNPTTYLVNLIFNRSKGIKSLSFRYVKETTLDAMDISRFTSAQDALWKLENFDIVYYPTNKYITSYPDNTQSIDPSPKCPLTSILTTLTESSSFLHTLSLSLSPSSSPPVSAIFALIKSQRHLQSLKINEFFPSNRYEELCSALSTQVRSLKHLELSEFSYFPLELEGMLVNCSKLERLDIRGGELKILEDYDHYDDEEGDDDYEYEEDNGRSSRYRGSDYVHIYNRTHRQPYDYYNVPHLQESSNRISVYELSISRCSSQDSVLHLLNLVNPFHLQRLAIDNCTTEIIDAIIECAPNLTHLDMRVASDVELQSSSDARVISPNIQMYTYSNYSTVNIDKCDDEEEDDDDEFYYYYESDLDTFEEFILSTKDCLHHLRCLEHFVLRLNTNITDSDFEIIDSVRDILDSLPRSVNHVGLQMNFKSIQELCIVLSGRRGDDLNKLDLCWQGKGSFEEVVRVLNEFWEDASWGNGDVEEAKVRLFYGYGGGLANNGEGFLNGRFTRDIDAKKLGEMLNENIVVDVIESPFIPLHFA